MKAIVKATGEIVKINESSTIYDARMCHVYNASELENVPDTDPDYWTRLEHQAAIAAMQSLIMTSTHNFGTSEQIAMWANEYATALVKELKEE